MGLTWHRTRCVWIMNLFVWIVLLNSSIFVLSLQNNGIIQKLVNNLHSNSKSSFIERKMSHDDDDTNTDSVGFEGKVVFEKNDRNRPSWSVTDNWNQLSQSDNINYDNSDGSSTTVMLNSIDQATLAALRMQNFGMSSAPQPVLSEEDLWIQNSIEQIVSSDSNLETNTDSEIDLLDANRFLDDLGNEIAFVVRCNDQALSDKTLQELRRLSPLPIKDNVEHLVTFEFDSHHDMKSSIGCWKATKFLELSVRNMFQKHVQSKETKWDAGAVASWMTQSLKGTADRTIGPHEKRVTQMLAMYGRDGTILENDLIRFYVDACVGIGMKSSKQQMWTTATQLERFRSPEIEAVWRDIRNHGIVTPSELENRIQQASILEEDSEFGNAMILDECEILDDDDRLSSKTSLTTDRQGRSSHERVELYRNVPIWLRDGDFGKTLIVSLLLQSLAIFS